MREEKRRNDGREQSRKDENQAKLSEEKRIKQGGKWVKRRGEKKK